MTWTIYALLAFLFIGIQRFLYKIAARLNLDSTTTTLTFMGTVALISYIILNIYHIHISYTKYGLFLCLINSLTFSLATISHINALKFTPASIVFPYIRLNILIVILYSYFIFGEIFNKWQLLGISTSIIALFLLSFQFKDNTPAPKKNSKMGIFYATIALCCGAISSISCKYATEYMDKFLFIFFSYVLSTVLLAIFYKINNYSHPKSSKNKIFKTLIIGISMGILNILGFYFYLMALSKGPLSIVATINGMHFVISVALSCIIFKERPNIFILTGIALTIISLILLT